jgi:hypothetical protein
MGSDERREQRVFEQAVADILEVPRDQLPPAVRKRIDSTARAFFAHPQRNPWRGAAWAGWTVVALLIAARWLGF